MNDINLFETKNSIVLKKIKSKTELSNEDASDGYLIESSEKESRRIIESLKGKNKIIALMGGDDAFNRRAIETLSIKFLVSPEGGAKGDTLKQRDSGINHVTAKEAADKGISLVINFGEISRLSGKEKSIRLEKIIQNVKICRRAKCNLKIANISENKNSLTDETARKSFGSSLGMSSEQTRDSTKF